MKKEKNLSETENLSMFCGWALSKINDENCEEKMIYFPNMFFSNVEYIQYF